MSLESYERLENIPEGVSLENFAKPIDEVSSETKIESEKSVENNEHLSEISENVEYFNPGLERMEILTDFEMTEKIADYLENVREFRYEEWTKLSLEERTEVLNRVEQKIAEIEHRPALKVGIETMKPNELGYQCATEHRIALNSNVVASNSASAHRAVIDTIIHEGRHAYQHYNVDVKCIHESTSIVKTWEKNFYDPAWGYYSYHGQKVYVPNNHGQIRDIGFLLYEQQPVEVDARNFTSDVTARLEAKGVMKSEAEINNIERSMEPSLEKAASTNANFESIDNNIKSNKDGNDTIENINVEESVEPNSNHQSVISFGNQWDDRTAAFLNECKANGIDLPSSVTHAGNGIDRSVNGGLTSIDKSIIENKLKSMHESGFLSDSVFSEMKRKLSSC